MSGGSGKGPSIALQPAPTFPLSGRATMSTSLKSRKQWPNIPGARQQQSLSVGEVRTLIKRMLPDTLFGAIDVCFDALATIGRCDCNTVAFCSFAQKGALSSVVSFEVQRGLHVTG